MIAVSMETAIILYWSEPHFQCLRDTLFAHCHLYINLNNTYLYYTFLFLGKNLLSSNTPKTADTNEPQRMPSFACPKIPAPPSNEA